MSNQNFLQSQGPLKLILCYDLSSYSILGWPSAIAYGKQQIGFFQVIIMKFFSHYKV